MGLDRGSVLIMSSLETVFDLYSKIGRKQGNDVIRFPW